MVTNAQRSVLELMARGQRLLTPLGTDSYAVTSGGLQLHHWTFPSLLRHGWIASDDYHGRAWRITDEGRAALTASPSPHSGPRTAENGGSGGR